MFEKSISHQLQSVSLRQGIMSAGNSEEDNTYQVNICSTSFAMVSLETNDIMNSDSCFSTQVHQLLLMKFPSDAWNHSTLRPVETAMDIELYHRC